MITGNVPCNLCTRCCQGDAIRLLPMDDADSYLTESHPYFPGALMLAHKPNKDCIYLVQDGCSIHSRRPQQCREMDCRLLAERITYTQARKLSKTNQLKFPVWQRGKELLKQSLGEKN
jgi:Fe-S-cluster containining protein